MDLVRAAFETNVFGLLKCTQIVGVEMMKRRQGLSTAHISVLTLSVINIGSMVGYKSTPWGGIYCATKACVHSLSDALRMELKNYGIKVMVVAPGAIKSEIGNANLRNLKLKGDGMDKTDICGIDSIDSLYSSVIDRVIARANTSQSIIPAIQALILTIAESHSTPASCLAKTIVDSALSSSPPAYLTTGATSTSFCLCRINLCVGWRFYLLYYLPTWISDWWIANLYGSDKVIPKSM
jgi:1-acylglycerone phosphate reductase